MPFHGIHDHTLDAKNRLTVPARFRAELAGGVVLALATQPFLEIYPAATHEQLTRSALAGLNPFSEEARDIKRHLYGNTIHTELDGAGRIMIPSQFLEHAGISKDAVVIGAGDLLEIWDRATWQDYKPGLIPRAADHIANVGHPS